MIFTTHRLNIPMCLIFLVDEYCVLCEVQCESLLLSLSLSLYIYIYTYIYYI